MKEDLRKSFTPRCLTDRAWDLQISSCFFYMSLGEAMSRIGILPLGMVILPTLPRFLDQYGGAAIQNHPCGEAPEVPTNVGRAG